LAASGRPRTHRPALSRPVAQTPALEAPLRAGRVRGGAGAAASARRDLPPRRRLAGLRGLDPAAPAALPAARMDSRTRRRLADTVAGLRSHPLRDQDAGAGPRTRLPGVPAALTGPVATPSQSVKAR